MIIRIRLKRWRTLKRLINTQFTTIGSTTLSSELEEAQKQKKINDAKRHSSNNFYESKILSSGSNRNISQIIVNGKTTITLNGRVLEPGSVEYNQIKQQISSGVAGFTRGMEGFSRGMEKFGSSMEDAGNNLSDMFDEIEF